MILTISVRMSMESILQFQEKIFTWWSENRRDFPWRETTNPYHIMVSEFQLQQTQATRVVPKYLSFISKYPTIESLSQSSTADVIREWQGLGYNRRAIWLKKAAETIFQLSYFPNEPQDLIKIRGIGPYTSRSIPIFAFNANLAAVDTNIRRILVSEGFVSEEDTKKQVQAVAEQLVPHNRSRDWHNALMDYGATYKTTRKTGIKPRTSQSRFEGSNRQLRGQVLKLLTRKDRLKLDEISQELDLEHEVTKQILKELVREGFLQKSENSYCLVI